MKIPLANNKLSLLLHDGISTISDPYVEYLFQGKRFGEFWEPRRCAVLTSFRILCNTSDYGKTRLLFEGLCQRWGFYFVRAQGPDGIGEPICNTYTLQTTRIVTQMSRMMIRTPTP